MINCIAKPFLHKTVVFTATITVLSLFNIAFAGNQNPGPFKCPLTYNSTNKYQLAGSAITIKSLPDKDNQIGYARGYCFYKTNDPSRGREQHQSSQEIRLTEEDIQHYNDMAANIWKKDSIPLPFLSNLQPIMSDYVCGTVVTRVNNKNNWVQVTGAEPKDCQVLSNTQLKDNFTAHFVAKNPIQSQPLLVKCLKDGTNVACNAFYDNKGENQAKIHERGGELSFSHDISSINIVWGNEEEMPDPKKTCMHITKEQLQSNDITLHWVNADKGYFACSPAGTHLQPQS